MNELLKQSLSETISVAVGAKAPNFKLQRETGKEWQLSDYLGSVVTLLFYPKNETFVCTKQLCSVRDNWNRYLETKSMIIGISPGTVSQHREFSMKHKLPFPLLADANRQITKTYGFHWLYPISFTRAIIVIDAKGIIRSRRIMLRAFRPSDTDVITEIYRAKAYQNTETYQSIAAEKRNAALDL